MAHIMGYFKPIMVYFGIVACNFQLLGCPGRFKVYSLIKRYWSLWEREVQS